MNNTDNTQRNIGIDLLRVIATIFIVLHHYQQISGGLYEGNKFFYGGAINFGFAVEFFFMLSGYLSSRGKSFKSFLLHKIIRLMQLLVISVVVYDVLLWIYVSVGGKFWGFPLQIDLLKTFITAIGASEWGIMYCNGINNPVWYISVLLLCYILDYALTSIAYKIKVRPEFLFVFVMLIGIAGKLNHVECFLFTTNICRGYVSYFWGKLICKFMRYKRFIEMQSQLLFIESVSLLCVFAFYLLLCNYHGGDYILLFIGYPLLIITCENRLIVGIGSGFRIINLLKAKKI